MTDIESANPHVLREYALLADGHRGALIGPRGEVSWLCVPAWHDDAVFSRLIGGAGSFAVTPSSRFVWGGHYDGTGLIWRSRWVTPTGITECREALAFPGDPHRAVLMRRIEALQGPAHVGVRLAPTAGFGRHGMREVHHDGSGCWTARVGDLRMRFTGAPSAHLQRSAIPSLEAQLTVDAGEHHDLVLEISDQALPDLRDPIDLWRSTEESWAAAVPPMDHGIAVADTKHSYSVLRGMTAPGGGMVAAATLGLPERARAGRNYDYRYVWIRDQCYAGVAAGVADPLPLMDDAVSFVSARLIDDGPELRPAYTIGGGHVPEERSLDLPGYPGGSDIVGNRAGRQFQLDAFGEALQLLATAARHDHLDGDGHRAMRIAADAVQTLWQRPDAGIWELENKRWAQSRLACAAGLRAAAVHAPPPDAGDWTALADAIVADTADCVHRSGRWQRAPDDDRVDAALLLPALRGAVPADDTRNRATVAAVDADLVDDFSVYRFRHDARPLHEAEGAFLLCGFLMALAQHQQGNPVAAARFFERNRAACGPPTLFSEEYDVIERQLRGNLPQAFVHALLVESAQRLAEPAGTTGTVPAHRAGRATGRMSGDEQ